MKFIREIIGEKRQNNPYIDRAPMGAVRSCETINSGNSADSTDTVVSAPEENAADEFEAQIDVKTQQPLLKCDEADIGVSKDVSKFFSKTKGTNLFQDDFEYFSNDVEDLTTARSEAIEAEKMDDVVTDAQAAADKSNLSTDETKDFDKAENSSNIIAADEDAVGEVDPKSLELSLDAEQQADTDRLSGELAIAEAPAEAEPSQDELSACTIKPTEPSEAPSEESLLATPASDVSQCVEVPQPAVGRGASRHGRVKTRLLGFSAAIEAKSDPIVDNEKASVAHYTSFPVGWLIVVEGAGRGSAFTLFHGVSTIGRGEDQTVRLDFGDNSISRESHASIAYDDQQKSFFIGHGGKANIVRRNNRPVLSTEELAAGDNITIGETKLRFVPFCGPEFSWEQETETGLAYASQG